MTSSSECCLSVSLGGGAVSASFCLLMAHVRAEDVGRHSLYSGRDRDTHFEMLTMSLGEHGLPQPMRPGHGRREDGREEDETFLDKGTTSRVDQESEPFGYSTKQAENPTLFSRKDGIGRYRQGKVAPGPAHRSTGKEEIRRKRGPTVKRVRLVGFLAGLTASLFLLRYIRTCILGRKERDSASISPESRGAALGRRLGAAGEDDRDDPCSLVSLWENPFLPVKQNGRMKLTFRLSAKPAPGSPAPRRESPTEGAEREPGNQEEAPVATGTAPDPPVTPASPSSPGYGDRVEQLPPAYPQTHAHSHQPELGHSPYLERANSQHAGRGHAHQQEAAHLQHAGRGHPLQLEPALLEESRRGYLHQPEPDPPQPSERPLTPTAPPLTASIDADLFQEKLVEMITEAVAGSPRGDDSQGVRAAGATATSEEAWLQALLHELDEHTRSRGTQAPPGPSHKPGDKAGEESPPKEAQRPGGRPSLEMTTSSRRAAAAIAAEPGEAEDRSLDWRPYDSAELYRASTLVSAGWANGWAAGSRRPDSSHPKTAVAASRATKKTPTNPGRAEGKNPAVRKIVKVAEPRGPRAGNHEPARRKAVRAEPRDETVVPNAVDWRLLVEHGIDPELLIDYMAEQGNGD